MAVGSRSGGGSQQSCAPSAPKARTLQSSGRASLPPCSDKVSFSQTSGWRNSRELVGRCCGGDTQRRSKGKGHSTQRVKGVLPTQHMLCANPPSHVFEILSAIS